MQAALRSVIRALPMTSHLIPGRPQSTALRALVRGDVDPCHSLDHAIDDLVQRAQSRDEAEALLLIPEVIRLYIEDRIATKFGAPVLDFHRASEAEQVEDNEVDLLQVLAGPVPTPSILYRLRAAIPRHIRALDALLSATHRRIVECETPRTWA